MDDEVLGCGGLLALLPHKERWHVLYATDGSGSPEPLIPGRDQVSPHLSAIRQQESQRAMASLGLDAANVHFLNLPDGRLQQHKEALRRELRRCVEQLQPEQVLVPFRYDRHPDHLALNHLMTELVAGGVYQGQMFEYFVYHRWRLLAAGDVRCYIRQSLLLQIDTTPVAAQKRAALDCFQSQTMRFYPWQTRPNLTPQLLDAVSREPEVFLLYDAALPGAAIFERGALWIRIAHRLEPFLKKRKDRLLARWQRRVNGA
jgi:LmbE family N-acetylglucosaminyl deacetylase